MPQKPRRPKPRKKDVDIAWEREWKAHAGDYGRGDEHELYCAFRAGWNVRNRYK